METSKNQEECCPRFEPESWDGEFVEWEDKKFIKDKVCTFFYMPINFGHVMRRVGKLLSSAGVTMPSGMCLSDHTSKWNMDVYVEVDREVAGANNLTISGKFLSKVYEGKFKDTGIWCKDFQEFAKSKGFNILKWYMWYTTCPKCAKKYGKNYVVILAKVE